MTLFPVFESEHIVTTAQHLPFTMQNVLKVGAMFYNPIELILSVVLQSKLIYKLCTVNLPWDTLFPSEYSAL